VYHPNPAGTRWEAADIAAAVVVFAVSDDAGWVTGTTMEVNGGMTF
jgi:3-oxoacyl-[acyl-carrier protein] reductase